MDLKTYNNEWYSPGSKILQLCWIILSRVFLESRFIWPSRFKCFLLRLFGAQVGRGVVIKPNVKIKYPWFLDIGDYTWIGEKVWIDNLAAISIGDNCCISQEAYLLTGNHDYKATEFSLIVAPINVGNGCWIGAKSIVCPGVNIEAGAILSVGSVANKTLEKNGIYQGNPAVFKRIRKYK